MNTSDIQNILRITVLASFADGAKHDRERDAIKNIADSLGQAEGVNLPSLYQDALLKRVNLEQAAAALSNDEARHLAYEMAVCVCDADGHTSPKEAAFLAQLRQALSQAPAGAAPSTVGMTAAGSASTSTLGASMASAYTAFESQAQSVADARLDAPAALQDAAIALPAGAAVPHPSAVDGLGATAAQRQPGSLSAAEMDTIWLGEMSMRVISSGVAVVISPRMRTVISSPLMTPLSSAALAWAMT